MVAREQLGGVGISPALCEFQRLNSGCQGLLGGMALYLLSHLASMMICF